MGSHADNDAGDFEPPESHPSVTTVALAVLIARQQPRRPDEFATLPALEVSRGSRHTNRRARSGAEFDH